MDENIKILIVDDQQSVRLYIQNLIKSNLESIKAIFRKTIEIVGSISEASETVRAIENLKPDVVILDLVMPDLNGCEIIAEIAATENIETKILIVSGEKYSEKIDLLLKKHSQVNGYVLKSRLDDDLITAILTVALDNIFVSKEQNSNYSINLLDIWKYTIAEKLIFQWRYGKEVISSPESMIKALQVDQVKIGSDNNLTSEILKKLRKAITEIDKTYSKKEDVSSSSLSKARASIRKLLNDKVFIRIDKSARVSRIEKICLFKQKIDPDWYQASPARLIDYLGILSENLEVILNSYEIKRNICLVKSKKVEQAFDRLKGKLEKEKSPNRKKQFWKYGMNALVVLNEQLLIAHICSAEISVLNGLIGTVENYYNYAVQADRLLLETQKDLNDWLEPVLSKIDVKSELESFTEQKLIEWGASPSVSSSLILDQLLSSINLVNISQELECNNKPTHMFSFTRNLDISSQERDLGD